MSDTYLSEEGFEALLKAAVIERCYEESGQYPPAEEIRKIFDSRTDLLIRKLIRKHRHKAILKKAVRGMSRAAAVILMVLGIAVGGLLQIDEVRASFVEFIKTIYEQYIRYDISNSGESYDTEFAVGYMSEGYELTEVLQVELISYKIYTNANGQQVTVKYITGNQLTEFIDNEDCIIYNFTVNDNECQCFIYDKEKDNKLSWPQWQWY